MPLLLAEIHWWVAGKWAKCAAGGKTKGVVKQKGRRRGRGEKEGGGGSSAVVTTFSFRQVTCHEACLLNHDQT